MKTYDVIIIGAGHNGLVAAAYLGRAGRKVLVLERREMVGGACVTEELWPGFKVSTGAYVNSLLRPEIIKDLNLKRFGFEMLPRNPSSFTPFPDGRHLILGPDMNANQSEVAKFSRRDSDALPRYEQFLDRVARLIEPTLMEVPPDPWSGRIRDLWKLGRRAWSMTKLGRDGPLALQLLTGAARPMLDYWFESDELKATLATDAVIGAMASPSTPGTGYVLLHHVMGECDGARGVWGYVRGGMGGISNALAEAARKYDVEIRCESPVEMILSRDGIIAGVVLHDGSEYAASVVLSNADAHVTFEKLIHPDQLPEDFLRAIRQIDYNSPSVKINIALSELPNFKCFPGERSGPQHRGTIHISPTMEYIERAYEDAQRGRPSESPILECTIPSTVDSTVAPDGQHVMSMFVQYGPTKLREGNWIEKKEKLADRCFAIMDEYAPNFLKSVIHRQVLSPIDIELRFGLTGGNIFQGAMTLDRMFFLRPAAGWAQYRTPIKGLYLCGAAAHPGGGVMGACGYNAAKAVIQDW